MRALRVDKLTLAALEGTLVEYRAGRAPVTVPVLHMLSMTAEGIEARAQQIAEQLQGGRWRVSLMSGGSAVGGGSAPGIELDTVLLALEHTQLSAHEAEQRLRQLDPPIVARIEDERVVLDLRTVLEEQDEALGLALAGID
jgi:L-seryl-tRNA(Ser) seleniumtransferase